MLEVGELAEQGPHGALALARELYVLSARDLGDLAVGLAAELALETLLEQCLLAYVEADGTVVLLGAPGALVGRARPGGECGARHRDGDERRQAGEQREAQQLG